MASTLKSIQGNNKDLLTMSEDQVAQYFEYGFTILENALNTVEIEALREDALKLCRWEYGPINNDTPPLSEESDADLLARHLCIHFPHKLSSLMYETLLHDAIRNALQHVIGANVKCMQSMLFIKASSMPGQAWHQDEIYIPTRDRSLTGAWIALDDARIDNGCLWVIPGSHKHGILWPQKQQQDVRFDCAAESYGFPYTDKDEIPVEVDAGSVLIFNGYLLHRSLPNTRKEGYRRVLVNHYMSAESLLPWFPSGEDTPMAQLDVRDIVMVCGSDPYAWKGTEDIFKAHLRPHGKGGCVEKADEDST